MHPNSFWQNLVNQNIGTYIPVGHHDQNLHNFSALENALGCSPKISVPVLPLNIYPGPELSALKQKIAAWLKVTPEMIVLGNGSDDLINLIPQVFVEPGDQVYVQIPTFFRIIEAVHKMKGKLVADPENSKIIWLCSPNNPTGVVTDLNVIDKLAGGTDALVVIDEAYQEIFDPENKQSAVRLLNKHPNLLVTRSFSKAFGLAGIRVGYVVGNKDVIGPLAKWQLNFPISVLSAKIAQEALDNLDFLKVVHDHFDTERKFIFGNIARLENIELGGKSETNVFILKHKKAKLFDLLLREGILTANFNQMNGLENQGFVRITIKKREENELLVNALRKIDKGN